MKNEELKNKADAMWQRFKENKRAIDELMAKQTKPIEYEDYFPSIGMKADELRKLHSEACKNPNISQAEKDKIKEMLDYYERMDRSLKNPESD